MKGSARAALSLAVLLGGCLSLPEESVCFEDHIVPLIRRDCADCHSNGEYGVTLRGNNEDYAALLPYILPSAPAESALVRWALGMRSHPPIWEPDDREVRTVEAWIREGASVSCLDRAVWGACRSDSDCFPVTCLCPDGRTAGPSGACAVDPSTNRGTCATEATCAEARFAHCQHSEIETPISNDAGVGPGGDPAASSDSGMSVDAEIPPTVTFSGNITPLLAADCARCHGRGQFGVRLVGRPTDYSEVMRYVDLDQPEAPRGFLWWASGGGSHVPSWPANGRKYGLFLLWVLDGAPRN